ncbi:MAG: glycosyltransferase family 2 protein [Candidatus Cloacimonetes bacterium]|nr:glycosyltransferase family 2 protein [Candidatus Cloacimonadota bacterium]
MYQIIGSIVTYKNSSEMLEKAFNSFLNTELNIKLYIIDNSPSDKIKELCKDNRIEYKFNNANLGFGAGHNIAIKRSLHNSEYHLILNPDVYFEKGTLEKIYSFMENNNNIGLLMPKVFYPDGSLQYLCKLLPTPFDWSIRRFIPIKSIVEKRNKIFELQFTNYNRIMDIPYLSGCFMFLRNKVINEVGMFEEGIFMYGEDMDLTRRIHVKYRTVFFPQAQIFHEFHKESHKNFRMLWIHVKSAIFYFNKWGWFFDEKRKKINQEVLKKIKRDSL